MASWNPVFTHYRSFLQTLPRIPRIQRRTLSIHEYQAQKLLHDNDIPTPRGKVARSPLEVRKAVQEIGGRCVIKSQINKGGRGKGVFENGLNGGIQIVESPSAAEEMASKMLGHRLITKQTSQQGLTVDKVYVAESVSYQDEWYLAMTIDRESYCPALIISKSGGVEIETIAKERPEHLHKFHFSLTKGISPDQLDRISQRLEVSHKGKKVLSRIITRMHQMFIKNDATLLEINPLVRLSDGSFSCIDSKFSFDNAVEARQPDLFALRDIQHEVTEEVEAENAGLIYVKMGGNIGNVVNGAGLAMATNDAIDYYGGTSANFLDTGGQATKETMQKAFEITMRDDKVKAILINIYGGIIRCDMIAESIISAAKSLGPSKIPVVVRLQGTNSQEGLKLLQDSKLNLHIEAEFGSAARKVVELANASQLL